MRSLKMMLLILVYCMTVSVGAQSRTASNDCAENLMLAWYNLSGVANSGQDHPVFNREPQSYGSPPLRPYVLTSPQSFIVVPDRHDFHDSQLPIFIDDKPRILIRSYDPNLGVYVDTEIRDPTCSVTCRNRETQADY